MMKKFIKCQDKNGEIVMVVTDTKTQSKFQRQGVSTLFAGKDDLINAYIEHCGLVREIVVSHPKMDALIASSGVKREYADTSVICTDKKGRRWAVCIDKETFLAHLMCYMSHRFTDTVEKNFQKEKDYETGVFGAFFDPNNNSGFTMFIGLSAYASLEEQLVFFCENNGLKII